MHLKQSQVILNIAPSSIFHKTATGDFKHCSFKYFPSVISSILIVQQGNIAFLIILPFPVTKLRKGILESLCPSVRLFVCVCVKKMDCCVQGQDDSERAKWNDCLSGRNLLKHQTFYNQTMQKIGLCVFKVSCDQNMTVSTISSELLILFATKLGLMLNHPCEK